MKVLLLKDVYKLGHAGDVKKVADGYGRNFLLPKGFAVLATTGAVKTIDKIREKATLERAQVNKEMSGIAEKLTGVELKFFSKARETGKLYGSITTQMVADELNKQLGTSLDRHVIGMEPIRTLGEHPVTVHLTVDLNPKVSVLVFREGEAAAKVAKTTAKKEEQPVVVESSETSLESASDTAEEAVIDDSANGEV